MGRRGRSPVAAIGERRAGSGPFDRDCERRALSPPRRRKPGSLRGGERSLLGVTARGETVCRPRGGVGRGGQFGWAGSRLTGEQGFERLASLARGGHRGEHVALPCRPY